LSIKNKKSDLRFNVSFLSNSFDSNAAFIDKIKMSLFFKSSWKKSICKDLKLRLTGLVTGEI